MAEDQDDLRDFLVEVLSEDFDVVTAADGVEAMEKIRAEPPDLLVSDVMMPRKSGVDICEEIKAHPEWRRISVILLTARSGNEATLEGYSAGADDFVGKPFHVRVLLARVRAQLKLQALALQLANQVRFVATGTLGAGVAHEVRNPLNAVVQASQALAMFPDLGAEATELVEVIADGADRILGVVSALEEHVRPADGDRASPCDIERSVRSSLRLIAHKLRGIEVEVRVSTRQRALVNVRHFNQVCLNLLDNAARMHPSHIWVDIEANATHLRLVVSDDGPGVSPSVATRIFDPFFPTREGGEGMGLGLFVSRSLMQQNDGTIRYEARDGGGARFVVELPGDPVTRERAA